MKRTILMSVTLPMILLCLAGSQVHALQHVSDGSDGPFHPTIDTTLDLPLDGVFNFTSITIPGGVTVTFNRNVSNTPAYLLATEDIQINGTVKASGGAVGENWAAGPGGFDGGPGGPANGPGGNGDGPGGGQGAPASLNPGGGGGFATPGDNGKTDGCVSNPGMGGGAVPYGFGLFHGGSGGGGGGGGPYEFQPGGDGGGGGGALYMSTPGTITVTGDVLANGRGGDGCYTSAFCWNRCGPAGGGSGGFIWIEAASIVLTENGIISCDKGPGGVRSSDGSLTHFGGDGGYGYVLLNASSYQLDGALVGEVPIILGDLDCNERFDGTDVLIQASMVVDLLTWEDLPSCITSYEDMMATCDWDCSGSIDGTDVLIGASIIVDILTEAETPLGQGACSP